MKTLKKTLCMVLAVVMVVGVLILPASADEAADKAKAQKAAYETLEDYGIMHGRDGGAAALDEYVRRDEVATIVYRIMTGDTTEDGKKAGNFKAAATAFTDVATTNWAAGFIGYTAESKIFSGRDGNKFDPTANVRGDELVKVMLRCLGYGVEGEYTGDGWNTRALYTAQEIGMLAGIDEQMDKPITRGAVSQIVANAIKLPMAVYYDGTYSIYHDNAGRPSAPNSGATPNATLVEYKDGKGTVKYDEWGAPSRKDIPTVIFNHPNVAAKNELDPVEGIKALATYTTAVTQCDLAEALGMEENKTFLTYTNGIENKTTTVVNPLNTTALIGAQGRYTAVYENPKFDKTKKDSATNPTYILVYKDTLLAKVTEVKARTYDAAGHLKTPATMKLSVYAANTTTAAAGGTSVKLTSKTADFTWTKDQYLLINYHQNDTVATNGNITGESDDVRTDKLAESWEEYQKYVTKTEVGRTASYKIEDWNEDGTINDNDFIKVLQEAPYFVGQQTLISYNSNTHTIDKVVYNNNNRYNLDDAKDKMKVNFTWYKDTYGNVIGSSVINAANSFGVINKIYWTGSNGDGAVYAEVTYVDGTTDKLAVNMMTVFTGNANIARNAANIYIGKATNSYSNNAMTVIDGYFYVNADAQVNVTADKAVGNGIINENLFKITAATGGTYDFVEVAGQMTSNKDEIQSASYKDYKADFTGLGNAETEMVSGRAENGVVCVDSETVFLVRSGSKAPYTFTSYVGYGKIGDYVLGEVDYANTDKDDAAAEVVYIKANPKGEQGWHLFFNTAVATSGSSYLVNVDDDGSNYIVHGILDGEAGTIKVKKTQQGWGGSSYNGANLADTIASRTNGNKLWMVYIKDGYVIDINGAAANTGDQKSVAETTAFKNAILEFADTANGMLTKPGYEYGDDLDELGAYAKLYAYTTVVTSDTNIEGETITLPLASGVSGVKVFGINGNVPLVGKWDDLETASVAKDDGGYQVIIVCDKDGKVVESYIFLAKAVGTSTGTGSGGTTVGKVTYDLSYSDGIGLKDITTKKDIPVDASGKITFTATTKTDIYDIKVSVTDPKADPLDPAVTYDAEVLRSVAGDDQYTYVINITGLTAEKDTKYNVNLIALIGTKPAEAEVNDTNYTKPTPNAPSAPDPGVVDTKTWSAGSTLYTALGITIKAGTKANEIIVEVDEANLNSAANSNSENNPYRLVPGKGDMTTGFPTTIDKGTVGYVGITVGTASKKITNIEVGSDLIMDGAIPAVMNGGMYLDFYSAIQWNGTKWVAKEGSFTVQYDTLKDDADVVDTHYTWIITIQAKDAE